MQSTHNIVTAVVSSSSRPQDADLSSLTLLIKVVLSVEKLLGPYLSTLTVAFDGPNPRLSSDEKLNYFRKIAGFQNWLSAEELSSVNVWINDEWTHQANMVKRVYNNISSSHKMTPFLFFTQDDSEVVGEVDTLVVLDALIHDPQVQYVRFYWQPDCKSDVFLSINMCDPKVSRYSGMLTQTPWYSDRPHFATTSFYVDNVFPKIPEDARNNPEVLVERKLVSLKTMWMYGKPGYMLHDVNHLSWSHNMEGVRIENVIKAKAEKKTSELVAQYGSSHNSRRRRRRRSNLERPRTLE